MSQIITEHGVFHLIKCFSCKVLFGMDAATYKSAMHGREDFTFYCTFGHPQVFSTGETTEDKLRRERDLLAQRIAQKDDEIKRQRELREHAERRASAFKGKVTRLKNRAAAGVCPCCNRQFQNLKMHMENKHPDFMSDET